MKNVRKLNGTALTVAEDYSPEVRENRRRLREYAKIKKADTDNVVRLCYDKRFLNGKASDWDTEKEEIVSLKRPD